VHVVTRLDEEIVVLLEAEIRQPSVQDFVFGNALREHLVDVETVDVV